jgi:hypothetical protein
MKKNIYKALKEDAFVYQKSVVLHMLHLLCHLINNKGEWSLDQISLDIFSWSKVSVKLGVWSKLFSFLFLSVDQISLDLFSWLKVLLMSFWVILNFWSTAKKEPTDFGSWSKVFKLIELVLMANF